MDQCIQTFSDLCMGDGVLSIITALLLIFVGYVIAYKKPKNNNENRKGN